jgi:hypothetical protein
MIPSIRKGEIFVLNSQFFPRKFLLRKMADSPRDVTWAGRFVEVSLYCHRNFCKGTIYKSTVFMPEGNSLYW